ncbi:dTDP-4-dehydrorhamnose reductase [Marinicauda salina]|uniref:dTDP-4-dehydrorhamnose reductase n=1 Tax=Marinicauda salina TaxID=2135793 RepID=A0A2U2BXF6_9PROT|nr:dTDP-4-dehydrorhamnose reductase [Marinicauda salina]PWE18692.1 dTDP-4-dehydrorhamnose reductase [Marinicauda salina]
MRGRRLLVLGRTGQLASELARRAPAAGWTIDHMGRDQIDFENPEAAEAAFAAAERPDLVINAAAFTAVDLAESEEPTARRINAETPARLATACADRAIPFIHISTDYVFDGEKDGYYTEIDTPAPRSAYGRTKLEGERAVAAAGGRALVVRTSWVYSPFGKNFVKTMLRLGEERDTLRIVDDQYGCPTAAGDLADGLIAASERLAAGDHEGGLYHLAGTGDTSWAGFADAIFERARTRWGRRPEVERIPSSEFPTPAPRPRNSRLDSGRFARDFGYAASAWRASLDATLEELGICEAHA